MNRANTKSIKTKVKQNSQVLDLFSVEQLIRGWEKKTGKEIAEVTGKSLRSAADYASATVDSATALKLISDLGVKGQVVIKNVKGKQYVIFKGQAGTRSIFTGTRYLATNPKVVDMAVGSLGVNKSIASGARLTIFLVVPLNILNHYLDDQSTMTRLVGKTATDLVKVGASAAIASLAATATVAVTTLAAGPLIVAIVVGLAVAATLDALDKKYGVTEALIKAMDDALSKAAREYNRIERHLEWQIMNGLPVGQGIFY